MAATRICEKCGRANAGDLCPGCAEPRPIRVRFERGRSPEHIKEIYDGVSEPLKSPFGPAAKLLVVVVLVAMISTTTPILRILGFCLIGLAGLLAVKPWIVGPASRALVCIIRRRR